MIILLKQEVSERVSQYCTQLICAEAFCKPHILSVIGVLALSREVDIDPVSLIPNVTSTFLSKIFKEQHLS